MKSTNKLIIGLMLIAVVFGSYSLIKTSQNSAEAESLKNPNLRLLKASQN